MTEPDPKPADRAKALDKLNKDAKAMERPDRAIPLPKDEDEDDGVGRLSGLVP